MVWGSDLGLIKISEYHSSEIKKNQNDKKLEYLGHVRLGLEIFIKVMPADIKEKICQLAQFTNILILLPKTLNRCWKVLTTVSQNKFKFLQYQALLDFIPDVSLVGIAWRSFFEELTTRNPRAGKKPTKHRCRHWDCTGGLCTINVNMFGKLKMALTELNSWCLHVILTFRQRNVSKKNYLSYNLTKCQV